MLVLTRRVGEEIVIGENIVVMIMSLEAGRARLGIAAPRDVGVRRGEVDQRVWAERDALRRAEDAASAEP